MTDSKVVQLPTARRPAQAIEVEGARLLVPPGASCAVGVTACVGLDEDGFSVIDGAAGAEYHFCKRHALAALALVSFAGFRGQIIPQLLRTIDAGELDNCGHQEGGGACTRPAGHAGEHGQ